MNPKKKKKDIDSLINSALNYKRKEIWLKPDITLKLKVLAAKNDKSFKEYCEIILTNHANNAQVL